MSIQSEAVIRATPGRSGEWAVWVDDCPSPDAAFSCPLDAVAYCQTLVDRGRVGLVVFPSGTAISAWGCGSLHGK